MTTQQSSDDTTKTITWGNRAERALLLLGVVLVIWAYFAPWLDLTSSGLNTEQLVSPWFATQHGSYFLLIPLVTVGMVTSALVLARSNRLWAVISAFALAAVSLVAWFVVVTMLPTAFALSSPFYDTTGEYGAGLAFAGYIFILIGSLAKGFEANSPRNEESPHSA